MDSAQPSPIFRKSPISARLGDVAAFTTWFLIFLTCYPGWFLDPPFWNKWQVSVWNSIDFYENWVGFYGSLTVLTENWMGFYSILGEIHRTLMGCYRLQANESFLWFSSDFKGLQRDVCLVVSKDVSVGFGDIQTTFDWQGYHRDIGRY